MAKKPVKKKIKKKRTSSLPPIDDLREALSVGHRPSGELAPHDEQLFKDFQSNLLSLISHELRTPLTGILNALNLLSDAETGGDFSADELISMAKRNALRLHQTLLALLDLAALESGTFQIRLREVNLGRLTLSRIQAYHSLFEDRSLKVQISNEVKELEASPLLADPQKISRALDLCFQLLIPRAQSGTSVEMRVHPFWLEVTFSLLPGLETEWETAWSQSVTGLQGGVAAPGSAFAGTLQSTESFLTRTQEGLGSEFLLVHEIIRLHGGKFFYHQTENEIQLKIELPQLSDEEGLKSVLSSRIYQTTHGIHTIALVLVALPEGESMESFRTFVKGNLSRATDAVYPLSQEKRLALVLDDCRPEDGPKLIQRMESKWGKPLRCGSVFCPEDGVDAEVLLALAEKRLKHQ